jgi:hypothetical protein
MSFTPDTQRACVTSSILRSSFVKNPFVINCRFGMPQSRAAAWILQTVSANNNGSPPKVITESTAYRSASRLTAFTATSVSTPSFPERSPLEQCLHRPLQASVTTNSIRLRLI